MASEAQIKTNMDRMYRWTRHIYDATRKYYLLGRDTLIKNLDAEDDDVVCEVGCGTARNLIKMAETYPHARFIGIDASDEMLKTAHQSLKKEVLDDVIVVKQGFAQSFDPKAMFNLPQNPDKLVFSYALSIIPPWRESVDHALSLLASGGEIHIVDFGGQEGLPEGFRKFLFWWLDKFHVYHKPEILEYLKRLEFEKRGTLDYVPLYRGYAWRAVFTKA